MYSLALLKAAYWGAPCLMVEFTSGPVKVRGIVTSVGSGLTVDDDGTIYHDIAADRITRADAV